MVDLIVNEFRKLREVEENIARKLDEVIAELKEIEANMGRIMGEMDEKERLEYGESYSPSTNSGV